jgi:hypothetical protein
MTIQRLCTLPSRRTAEPLPNYQTYCASSRGDYVEMHNVKLHVHTTSNTHTLTHIHTYTLTHHAAFPGNRCAMLMNKDIRWYTGIWQQ